MQKIICKKLYDTEAAELIRKICHGNFGDPAGYEESLYRMPDGAYFLYTNGGAESPCKKKDIKRLSAAKAEEFLTANA